MATYRTRSSGGVAVEGARESTRARLLAAAAQVYAKHGYHGATTRLIAIAAGVNEVTLFRLFGSKDALLDEAIRTGSSQRPQPALPSVPLRPREELAAWCRVELARLGDVRELLQQCFADPGSRPRRARPGELVAEAAVELRGYCARLEQHGHTRGSANRDAAIAMLLSTLLADAVGHDELRALFPVGMSDAAARYADAFLDAVGCSTRRGWIYAEPPADVEGEEA